MARALTSKEQEQLDQMFGGGEQGKPLSLVGDSAYTQTNLENATGAKGSVQNADTQGTGFINAQQYLDANKGKGKSMADRVAGQAASDNTGLENSANALINKNITDYNPEEFYNSKIGNHLGIDYDSMNDEDRKKRLSDEENYWNDLSAKSGDYSYGSSWLDENEVDDLWSKIGGPDGTKSKAEKAKTAMGKGASGSQTRTQILKDLQGKSGLSSYDDNAAAFDSMFMEAEGADQFNNTYNLLQGNLDKYFGTGADNLEKKYNDKKAKIKEESDDSSQILSMIDEHSKNQFNNINEKKKAQEEKEKLKAIEDEKIKMSDPNSDGIVMTGPSDVPGRSNGGVDSYWGDDLAKDITKFSQPVVDLAIDLNRPEQYLPGSPITTDKLKEFTKKKKFKF